MGIYSNEHSISNDMEVKIYIASPKGKIVIWCGRVWTVETIREV